MTTQSSDPVASRTRGSITLRFSFPLYVHFNKFRKAMSPEAEKVWKMSEDYVETASEFFGTYHPNAGMLPVNDGDRELFRIAFLFPLLRSEVREDLLPVRQFFLCAKAAREFEREDPTKGSAEFTEALADDFASKFREALPSFTPIQQEILREHFLLYPDGVD